MFKITWKKIIFLAIVGFFVYRYFFYIDIGNKCFVKIKPSFTELSNRNIKQAILVLKNAVPKEYEKFCRNVDTIDPNISCGGFGGGCYYHNERGSISVSTSNNSFLGWTAAIIAHETCHVVQHNENRPFSETECYTIDNNVLKSIVKY